MTSLSDKRGSYTKKDLSVRTILGMSSSLGLDHHLAIEVQLTVVQKQERVAEPN